MQVTKSDKFYDKMNSRCSNASVSRLKYIYRIGTDIYNISFTKYIRVINLTGTKKFSKF